MGTLMRIKKLINYAESLFPRPDMTSCLRKRPSIFCHKPEVVCESSYTKVYGKKKNRKLDKRD